MLISLFLSVNSIECIFSSSTQTMPNGIGQAVVNQRVL